LTGYLRVRVDGARYGLRVDQIIEVVDEFEVMKAPGVHPAVMGVTPMRRRLVPLVQLAALIADGDASEASSGVAVLAHCLGSLVAFEVGDVEEVVRDAPLPVPDTWQLPWASGVVRHEGELIPVVDLEVLAERLVARESELGDELG
jgi:purine-binding chemotaxis protein CheW